MKQYQIHTCVTGYIVHEDQGAGMMYKSWAFTTAVEAADKLLQLLHEQESQDDPA